MLRHKLLLPLCLVANLAHASCGSAFCTVNTGWDTQGLAHDTGLLVDLQYSYARADQWRAGAKQKSTEAPSGSDGEIENKRTINRLANLNLDYALNRQWAILLGLPFVMRDHEHTFDSSISGPFSQRADFNELGDIRLQARYSLELPTPDTHAGVRFGVKLPTGATDKTMSPADPADPGTPYALERSGQPGSGSTDGILGAYYAHNAPGNGFGWFVSGQLQAAVAIKDHYRPGNELKLDAGIHYEVLQGLNLLFQVNAQHRARDTGSNANPASGGYSISLSPGMSYAVTPQTQVYFHVQRAVVQYLNADPADSTSGQLAARWGTTVGISHRF